MVVVVMALRGASNRDASRWQYMLLSHYDRDLTVCLNTKRNAAHPSCELRGALLKIQPSMPRWELVSA